jgi:hypothetical protein
VSIFLYRNEFLMSSCFSDLEQLLMIYAILFYGRQGLLGLFQESFSLYFFKDFNCYGDAFQGETKFERSASASE